jgi:murein DD-endopeptidase MepM/ murein hydrolase activator NlpD
MSEPSDNKRSIRDIITDKYRLVILDDDTLGEKKSMRFTLLGLLSTIFFTVFLISGLTYLIVILTPLRFLIPGYGDIANNKVYMDLNQKIELLEKDIDNQRIYTEAIKNRLNPSALKADGSGSNDSLIRNSSIILEKKHKISNVLSLEHYYFCTPLKGEISAEFDLPNKHYGIDIVATKDSPVKSILDGVVINADWSTNTGNTISVQHDDNMVSVYKHNSVLLKKIGDKIGSCEAIAIIGNTGKLTSGPHVHFELWKNGIAVDPSEYISFN